MKLKYILKKNLNIKNGYLIAIMITLILVVGGYFSYAIFTTTSESKGALNIVTGNLYSYIDSTDLDVNKEVTLAPNEVKFITIKLTNINTIAAKVNLYYSLSEPSDKLEIGYYKSLGDEAPTNEGVILGKSGSGNDSKTIVIRIVNDDSKNIKVSFGSDVGLEAKTLDFPTGKSALEPLEGNINLIRAYTYNQERDAEGNPVGNFCVTGEEETCQINDCYTSDNASSCPVGTIIRYRVNDENKNHDIRYFHVMKDDGEHLTMQQRESLVDSAGNALVNWNASWNFSQGPVTALEFLDSQTSGWKYVNDQTIKMGETVFGEGEFASASTGGTEDMFHTYEYSGYEFKTVTIPDVGVYNWTEEQTRKARMITLQEAMSYGCKDSDAAETTPASCPIWMYNYTYSCIKRGCTVEDSKVFKYHTMNAGESLRSSNGIDRVNVTWSIDAYGKIYNEYRSFAGVRAVVEVNKQ